MSTELVRAFNKFRTQNTKIKERQRAERARELDPYMAAIGREILELQQQGRTITEIGQIISLKNRTFIYEAKRAFAAASGEARDDIPRIHGGQGVSPVYTPGGSPVGTYGSPDVEFGWNLQDNLYVVTVDGSEYNLYYDSNDELVIPQAWIDNDQPALDVVYAQIYQEIDEHHAAA